jgi:hypothetical protein
MKIRFFVIDSANQLLPGCKVSCFLNISSVGAATNEGSENGAVARASRPSSKARSAAVDEGAELQAALLRELLAGRERSAKAAEARPIRLELGSARTDRCGYGVIDLGRAAGPARAMVQTGLLLAALSDAADLELEVAGAPSSAVPLFNGTHMALMRRLGRALAVAAQDRLEAAADLVESAFEGALDAFRLVADASVPRGAPGHVAAPDRLDYELSPASFVARRAIPIGDGDCEHLTPATLPLRQYALHHVVVYDRSDRKPAQDSLPTVAAEPPLDRHLRWGLAYEFEQTWTSLGHSLGEVKYSLPLAPGEAVKVAVVDWRRDDAARRAGANASQDALVHEQAVDRDIEDIVTGRVSEAQSGESFMAGLAGAMDFQIPQYGISAAGRHSVGVGMSSTRGTRDLAAEAQQRIQLQTLQRSSLARAQSSSVVVQATQAETSGLATRIVANMNRGHALTILYYEVLRHLAVRTRLQRADPVALVPVNFIVFDRALALRYRVQLEAALLDPQYAAGFAALERIGVGAGHGTVPASPSNSAPPPPPASRSADAVFATQFEVRLKTGWRWRAGRYDAPPDTAGSIRVLARLANGTDVLLAEVREMPFITEVFGHIYNLAALGGAPNPNGRWAITFDDPNRRGFCFATTTANTQPIDLRQVRAFAVEWKPNSLAPDGLDGWNLQEAWITPQLQSGPLLLGHFRYSGATGELFGNGADGRRTTQSNHGIPLVNTDRLTATPAPTPSAPTPASPPPAPTGAIDDFRLADLLLNHLNANRYHYSAAVWLDMDPRERHLRLAPFAGTLLSGLAERPITMSGNHLVFRYSGELPREAEAALPKPAADLKPTESIVTLPTRGIFAEAHLGHCNAAEKRDITRLWNFDELPVSLLPNIETLTAGPRGSLPTLSPDAVGASPLDVAATPELPAPGGAVAAALELLAKPDIFRDQSTREQVADIMGQLIKSAQPPKLGGAGVGSAFGGGARPANGGAQAPTPPVSSPDEWANPFENGGSGSDGEAFIAERYGRSRLTDETDRLRLAPELASNLFDTGLTEETVNDIIGKYAKGTTSKVTRTPKSPKLETVQVMLSTRSALAGGPVRPLNGYFWLTFHPIANRTTQAPTEIEIGVEEGNDGAELKIPAGSYAVRARYRPRSSEDVAFVATPQMGSIGSALEPLPRLVMDILQQDLADAGGVFAKVRGTNVTIAPGAKTLELELVLDLENNQYLNVEFDAGIEEGVTVAADGKVNFDTSKLVDLADKVADLIKVRDANIVALLLSLFSLQGNVGLDGKVTSGASGKATFRFSTAFIRDFSLRQVRS